MKKNNLIRQGTFGSWRLAMAVLLGLSLLTWGCGGTESADGEAAVAAKPAGPERLSYTGCGITKKAFMAELGAAFQAKTGVEIGIGGGGATKGIVSAAAGSADLGGGCRHKLGGPEEANAVQHHVAWDALVAIVHPDSPLDNLSTEQLRQVLTGEVNQWEDLRVGKQGEILVGARSGKISGVGRMVRELIFGDLALDYTAQAIVYPSSGPLEQAVEAGPDMIAVTGISSAKKRNVKVLAIDGIQPTYENIAAGTYPYYRPLFLYTSQDPDARTAEFVAFAQSAEGQDVIRAQGTVNLEDGRVLEAGYRDQMSRLGIENDLWSLDGGQIGP